MIHLRSLTKFLILFLCVSLLGFSPNPKYITESDDYHVVKKSDTLYSIAKKYSTTVDALKRINNLTSDKILIGQKIYLRNKEHPQQYYVTKKAIPSSGFHVIQKGETLYRLSKIYDIPIEQLMELNQLTSYTIKAGEKLLLKGKPGLTTIVSTQVQEYEPEKIEQHKPTETKTETIKEPAKQTKKPKYHVVKKGETLYRIASTYGLSIYELKNYNSLSSDNIFVGQKLYLETQSKNDNTKYTIPKPVIKKSEFQKYGIIWPCTGQITSGFGTRDGKPHKGLDIACPEGTPLKAVLDGEVAYSGKQRGYGNVIILKHSNSIMTVYAHNQENLVHKDDKVKKGEIIGKVGLTGNTTGAHVHFEVRLDGRAYDPLQFLP